MFNPEFLKKDARYANTGRKPVLTPEQVEKVLELVEEGYTPQSVGKAFGVSRSTIVNCVNKHKNK